MAISILFLFSSFLAAPAFATPTVSAVTSVATSNQGILPNSPPTALLRVQVTFAAPAGAPPTDDTLIGITAAVIIPSGFGLYSGGISQLSIYKDDGDGIFSSADGLAVASQPNPVPGTPYTLSFSDAAYGRRADHTWWYFIVIRTSASIKHADAFQGRFDGLPSGDPGTFALTPSIAVQCECKVVDLYYQAPSSYIVGSDWENYLVSQGLVTTFQDAYWQPYYISDSIVTEMTEPNETNPDGTPHSWFLDETGNERYSYLTGGDTKSALSNVLKLSRKRKLLQMFQPTAVLGIKVAGNDKYQSAASVPYYDHEYLNSLVINFKDTNGLNFNAEQMLFSINGLIGAENLSGVAIYQDSNHNGVLDAGETPLRIWGLGSGSSWSPDGNQLTLSINHTFDSYAQTHAQIPLNFDADTGYDPHDTTGTDFLVVIRAKPETALIWDPIEYGADFTVKVSNLTVRSSGTSVPNLTDYYPSVYGTPGFWNETKEIKAVLELHDTTGTAVDPNSTFPVIGINVVDGPALFETFDQMVFQVKDEPGFDPNIDLTAVSIYQDNGSLEGVFDASDSPVSGVTSTAWSFSGGWWQKTIYFPAGVQLPPDDGPGAYQGDDYYVVLTTSPNFGYKDKITCRIPDGGISFSTTTLSCVGSGITTNALINVGGNHRIYWDPWASPETPLKGNVSVVFSAQATSLKIKSEPTAVMGLELASNTIVDTPVLKSVILQVIDTVPANFSLTDLAVMDTDSRKSGFGIWKDNGDGVFDADTDTPLIMAVPPSRAAGVAAENYSRYLLLLNEAQNVDTALSGKPDYFITVKTSSTISSGDNFRVRIWGSEMKPFASYGLGFREKDTGASSDESGLYTVSGKTTSSLFLGQPLGDGTGVYSQYWYLVVTGGDTTAIGKVYKVSNILDPTGAPEVESSDADFNAIGNITGIRLFKLESTSYRNGSADLSCSGIFNIHLDITQPSLPGEIPTVTPTGPQYSIQYDADAAPGTLLALYRVKDPAYTDTTLIVGTGLPLGFGQTYIWNTNTAPSGTYRIYGILGSAGNTDTAYSVGTVTITNSSPTAGSLTILPSPVGNSGSISLADIVDADSNILTITFYSTDSTGVDTRFVPGTFTVSPPYPNPFSPPTPWDTSLVPAGPRRLFARISDGVNPMVLIGPTAFTINHPPSITITAPSAPAEKALNHHYTIQWIAGGLDTGTETVNLYRVDPTYADTQLIHSGSLATSGSYDWSTASVPNGIYRIYGTVTDGTYTNSNYSVGTVDVGDFVSTDTTIHIIQPAVDILLDGAMDTFLYPLSPPVISRGQALAPFKASDNIRWFDTWILGEWDPAHDALWLDPDGDGLYGPEDTLLAGVAPTIGFSGVLLTSLNPFAYWDVNSSSHWDVGEAILYEGGEGNRRFYYSDPVVHITWGTTPPGGTATTTTLLQLYLEKSGVYDEIFADTVLVGSPLAGSFDYDFSQLTMLQHGLYHVILRVIDPNGWYPPVDHYALVDSSLVPVTITVDSAPNLIITRPEIDADIWPGYPYDITYIATDPDSAALFSLYAYDAATADTYPIVGPLTETDSADSYLWYASLDASIPRNVYLNIMGVISDGVWTDTAQASGRVRILETAPSVLLKADSTDTVIILTWTDNTPPGETKTYTIWRQDITATDSPLVMIEGPGESNPPEPILIDPATNTWQYIDNDITLQKDHVYYYHVVVNITEGGNAYVFNSNTVAAMLLAFNQNPTGLAVVPGRLMANLSWNWANGNVILEDGFSIERRVRGAQTFTVIGGIPGNDVLFGLYTDFAYSDTMLRYQGSFWQYRVRAFKIYANGNIGYSGYSSIVEAEIMPSLDTSNTGSGGGGGGGGAVGPLAVGISALLGWWKRRKRRNSDLIS